MSLLTAAAVAAGLMFAEPETAPPAAEPDEVVEVVVVAKREEAVRNFVSEVTATAQGQTAAIWDRKICPGVVGLKAQYAQALIDRMALIAFAVGLDVGEEGCRPQILVVFTRDAEGFVAKAVKDNPGGFDKWEQGTTRGRRAFKDFIETPRPVRWWHVTRQVTSDGFQVAAGGEVTVRNASRLRGNVRQDFDRVIIVVDAERIDGVTLSALNDYVAMVALAQVSPDAQVEGYNTVLSLFADRDAGRTPPPGLTEWDLAYLKALYEADRDAKSDRQQRRRITDRMRRQNR